MSSLSFPYPAVILIAALAAALIFHLSRVSGPQRLVHAAYAAAALGLSYLLGAAAFGWAFEGQGALLWAYLALFVLAAVIATRRRLTLGAIGLPWLSATIQLGVVAYMFAPESIRKPPVTAALFLYFIFEALLWLRGRQIEDPSAPGADKARKRPPLFTPQRRRGLAEISLAAAAVAISYLLFVGPAAHVRSGSDLAQHEEPQIEQTAEETTGVEEPAAETIPATTDEASTTENRGSETAEAARQVAAHTPVEHPTAATEPEVYTARAGDTFKSIAKRLYGATSKWRAIADANPHVKSKRLQAGQLITLPSSPIR